MGYYVGSPQASNSLATDYRQFFLIRRKAQADLALGLKLEIEVYKKMKNAVLSQWVFVIFDELIDSFQ